MISQRTDSLCNELKELYKSKSSELLYHGWHHIFFVAKKSVFFANEFENTDKELIEAAALTHDLNYLVEPNSEPELGQKLRKQYLQKAEFTETEINEIEAIVMSAHMATRNAEISNNAKSLSDADTLFKSLPITPVLLAGNYIKQNKTDVKKLSYKIATEQRPLMDEGIYFYTKTAADKYTHWADINLHLWENIHEAMEDEDVNEMLNIAYDLKVL